jgi:hypothetical protein
VRVRGGGWRFGCALCIEVHLPELFLQYAELAVDCVLVSAYADEPMFGIQAQGYAASHSYWVSLSIPTQMSGALTSRLIAPSGEIQAVAGPSDSGIVVDLLDKCCPRWEIALHRARPWRALARDGEIYRRRFAEDPWSQSKGRILGRIEKRGLEVRRAPFRSSAGCRDRRRAPIPLTHPGHAAVTADVSGVCPRLDRCSPSG